MSCSWRKLSTLGAAAVVSMAMFGSQMELSAQSLGNDYIIDFDWLPEDHEPLGTMVGMVMDPFDNHHRWIVSRCGANICAGTDVDPIKKFDPDGNLVDSFGAGWFSWPHGVVLDHEGYLWITEGAPQTDRRGAPGMELGLGHTVKKIDLRSKQVVMTIGQDGVPGCTETLMDGPSGVAVNPANGDVWVTDSHRGGNNRVIRFSPQGEFIAQWGGCVGEFSGDPGKFNDPHHLVFDRWGRLIVVDRSNNRLQVFNPDNMELITIWTQFGQPSGIFIDDHDNLYVTDGVSTPNRRPAGYDYLCCQGWQKGIYIANAENGWITQFLPDVIEQQAGIEFVGVDPDGTIYAGYEPEKKQFVRYIRYRSPFNAYPERRTGTPTNQGNEGGR